MALAPEQVGFILEKLETLAFHTTFNPQKKTGQLPINTSLIDKTKFKKALTVMSDVFKAGICVSDLVAVAGADTARATLVARVRRRFEPPQRAAWVDTTSFSPVGSLWVRPDEPVRLEVRAAPELPMRRPWAGPPAPLIRDRPTAPPHPWGAPAVGERQLLPLARPLDAEQVEQIFARVPAGEERAHAPQQEGDRRRQGRHPRPRQGDAHHRLPDQQLAAREQRQQDAPQEAGGQSGGRGGALAVRTDPPARQGGAR